MNEYRMAEITVGMRESFRKKITAEMEDMFREISGDENPLHRDDEFARNTKRFTGHISFGMLTASLYSTLAGMYLPGRYSLIHSFDELAFLKPVMAGDVLTVTGEVIGKEEGLGLIRLKAVIMNQEDKMVSRARIKILVLE